MTEFPGFPNTIYVWWDEDEEELCFSDDPHAIPDVVIAVYKYEKRGFLDIQTTVNVVEAGEEK